MNETGRTGFFDETFLSRAKLDKQEAAGLAFPSPPAGGPGWRVELCGAGPAPEH